MPGHTAGGIRVHPCQSVATPFCSPQQPMSGLHAYGSAFIPAKKSHHHQLDQHVPRCNNTCMKTKLTLTVEASAVRKLKSLAQRHRTSVSALLEEWSARAIPAISGPSLGQRLHGRWVTRSTSGDPRLEFLLRMHAA